MAKSNTNLTLASVLGAQAKVQAKREIPSVKFDKTGVCVRVEDDWTWIYIKDVKAYNSLGMEQIEEIANKFTRADKRANELEVCRAYFRKPAKKSK